MLNKEFNIYNSIFAQCPDGIFLIRKTGEFILINPKFSELSGYSTQELSHMKITDILFQSKDVLTTLKIHLQKFNTCVIDRLVKCKIAPPFFAQINLKLMEDGCIIGVVHDVSAQKKLLQQLQNDEENFRQMSDHIRDVFFLIDLVNNQFLYISKAYEEIWQQATSELIKKTTSWMRMIHPEDRLNMETLCQEHLKTGWLDAQFRIVRQDGTERWIHARAFPIFNEQNQLYRSAGVAKDVTEQKQIVEERVQHATQIQNAYIESIHSVASALEKKDPFTAGHQNKVALLASGISNLLNLPTQQCQGIVLASKIHDIGKIGIPMEILTKPSKLSTIESDLIKTHAQIGYDILKNSHFPWPIAEIVCQHHERINGSGYPKGLKAEDILIEAKVIAVADTVDAMASHRPYRAAIGLDAALKEIQSFSNILYDSDVVKACVEYCSKDDFTLYP